MTGAAVRPLPPRGIVPIIRVRRDGDVLRFVDPCPFCHQKHAHGVGDGGRDGWYGHRVAHCASGLWGGYYLLEDGAPLPQEMTP